MAARITVNSNIRFGKPHIAGTRITVTEVLELLREGISFDSIRTKYYPDLTVEDIQACVTYAIDIINVETVDIAAETP